MAGRKSRNPNPKPMWKAGLEMPPFSGKNWWELEDIYSKDKRIGNDIWRVIGLMAPAWLISKQYCKELVGEEIDRRSFEMLCFMQRIEEARENAAIDSYAILKSLNIGGTLYYKRKADLHRLGLLERLPIKGMRLYRVTQKGKLLIKNFHDNLHQANENIGYWISLQNEATRGKINKLLWTYYPGWDAS